MIDPNKYVMAEYELVKQLGYDNPSLSSDLQIHAWQYHQSAVPMKCGYYSAIIPKWTSDDSEALNLIIKYNLTLDLGIVDKGLVTVKYLGRAEYDGHSDKYHHEGTASHDDVKTAIRYAIVMAVIKKLQYMKRNPINNCDSL